MIRMPPTCSPRRAAKGFMPDDEGDLLFDVAVGALAQRSRARGRHLLRQVHDLPRRRGPRRGQTVFTVDHHRGSEEHQAGWEYHDPSLVDPEFGRLDTLPAFRRTLKDAGLEDEVVAVVGRSTTVSALWRTPLALVFIDGGHTDEHAGNDYEGWGRWVARGGPLVIHDVFPDPADGGQAPYRDLPAALDSGLHGGPGARLAAGARRTRRRRRRAGGLTGGGRNARRGQAAASGRRPAARRQVGAPALEADLAGQSGGSALPRKMSGPAWSRTARPRPGPPRPRSRSSARPASWRSSAKT